MVVVFFLVLYHFDGHHLARLVVLALQHLSESTLANQLYLLEAVPYLVTRDDSIVALVIVEAVINEPLKFSGLVLLILLSEIVDFFVLSHLCLLVDGKVILGLREGLQALARDGEGDRWTGRAHLHRQLVTLRHLRDG